ncbi:MAG: hypothetical protein CSA26_00910 [Desulfobacterales bacterium]|nr:MAG: hypothetical protein CSA26_00910 [Desulfobacterales bacterium]
MSSVRTRNRSTGAVGIQFDSTSRKTKQLLVGKGLSKAFDDNTIFSDLDIILSPGSRLGVLGRNGTGKSTLMQILAAAGSDSGAKPDSGTIKVAENLTIVSFDQRREQLDLDTTLKRALAPDGDSVVYQGRTVHVVSWAKRFLFRPDQLDTPVSRLSGGEQARILIARLMLRPADILLLDEPTNDLDIPSLDVLEESLREFRGALVLVSHDRFMLDQICTMVLGFSGSGQTDYFADYEQWLQVLEQKKAEKTSNKPVKKALPPKPASPKPGKLSYMDQREYDQLEDIIMEKETRIQALQELMTSDEATSDATLLEEYWKEQQTLQEEVEHHYARWDELETLKNG